MPKVKLEVPSRSPRKSHEEIEAFAAKGDHAPSTPETELDQLDPHAPHDFKGLSIKVNEYTWKIFDELCKRSGRGRNNLLRRLILEEWERVCTTSK